jgi:DNA-binding LacI/PurR family transcriptional regulator
MKRPSMATVARLAGVSKNAVSLALRGDPQIPERTRVRIEAAARQAGYVRNPVVASLMAELRRSGGVSPHRTLALVNANQDRDAFRTHPTIPVYVAGVRRRAEQLGFGLDAFWLHDPDLARGRLRRILDARGIEGVLLVGLMKENRLPPDLASVWTSKACVVAGVRTRGPTLPFACSDHHELVLEAMERVRQLGYRRPALVVDARIDALVDGRFSAGMHVAQQAWPEGDRVVPFLAVEDARADPTVFRTWFRRHRPDALLTLYTVVKRWVEALGLQVPRDVGLVQLERRPGCLAWAGMDQRNDLTGEAGVDMLDTLLQRGETGVQAHPQATFVSGAWTDGVTVSAR